MSRGGPGSHRTRLLMDIHIPNWLIWIVVTLVVLMVLAVIFGLSVSSGGGGTNIPAST
jgi:hypothetical protein